jgi:hypothetical protein
LFCVYASAVILFSFFCAQADGLRQGIPAELHRKVVLIAEKNNISLNELVKHSLCYAVNNEKSIEELISN